MGMNWITIKQDGKDYRYLKVSVLLTSDRNHDLIQELLAIPKQEQRDEIIRRLSSGTLQEQLRAILTEILGTASIQLPQETKASALSVLESLGGLY